jgi:hypothetical protein
MLPKFAVRTRAPPLEAALTTTGQPPCREDPGRPQARTHTARVHPRRYRAGHRAVQHVPRVTEQIVCLLRPCAEAALGVTGRVDLDLHEAAGRTVRQPAAALAMHADRFPRSGARTGRPGERRRGTSTLQSAIRSRSSPTSTSIRPLAGPRRAGVGPGGDRARPGGPADTVRSAHAGHHLRAATCKAPALPCLAPGPAAAPSARGPPHQARLVSAECANSHHRR